MIKIYVQYCMYVIVEGDGEGEHHTFDGCGTFVDVGYESDDGVGYHIIRGTRVPLEDKFMLRYMFDIHGTHNL